MEENHPLTNFEKWRIYTDGLTSPDNFIDMGFYFIVSAALQRRVWLPPSHKPIFPNLYLVLVGPPGVGKGLVITEVSKFLKYHKLEDPYEKKIEVTGSKESAGEIVSVDREVIEACAHADYLSGKSEEARGIANQQGKSAANLEKALLIPMAADATSYEALVSCIARSIRRKQYSEFDERIQRNVNKIYTHSSVSFCLEELSSLFRKKAEDVVRFLQITFDCGDYKKDTKTQGTDRIQRCCVSLMGGATREFMQRLFKDELADEGFASRSIFVYEPADRKIAAFIPELNELQKSCEKYLLDHVKKLTNLYGQITVAPDASLFIEEWHRKAQIERPNVNEKLQYYYARKKIHLMKLATCIHFAESLDMELKLPECQRALQILNKVEIKMHHALVHSTKNPYYKLGVKLIEFLERNGPRSIKELRAALWEDLPSDNPYKALDETLTHFIVVGRIRDIGNQIYAVIKESGKEEHKII